MTTAERRMFAKTIIDSDAFLDMPLSTQALYFHLSMRADDDGFINNPKKVQRMIGCSEDDLKLLIAKNFIIPFESGIVVIKHWKIHNYIQSDRYKPTVYQEEKSMLTVKENKAYTECIHDGYGSETQVRLGKDSIGKSNNNISNTNVLDCQTQSDERVGKSDIDIIVNCWNALKTYGIVPVSRVSASSKRGSMLRARIREYGTDEVLKAIDNIRKSDFLKGNNNRDWTITFDWFVKPSNFPKVLEGNYNRVEEKKLDKKPTNGRQ